MKATTMMMSRMIATTTAAITAPTITGVVLVEDPELVTDTELVLLALWRGINSVTPFTAVTVILYCKPGTKPAGNTNK
jgi:hypothetical protein